MLDTVGAITDYIRQLISVFDYVAYFFLSFTYQLFYNIVNFNFLDGKMIFSLFSRIQLIIGVFMMFQLAITILKGIINPDTFTDGKTGAGNLVMRIAVSLTLLAMLVPINIPNPHNEYEKQINNSGILFGTLYSLQHRILKNNTIGKLIFGNDDTDYTSSNPDDSLFVAGNQFSTTLVKSFYVLNVDDNGDFVCPSEEDDYVDNYNNTDENYANIIYLATAKCNSNGDVNGILSVVGMAATATGHLEVSIPLGIASYFTGEEAYVVMMVPFISTLAAVVIAILLIMMSFEVAVRALKLMSLQLMAPIPIISYMDPKGGKDGAFNSWVKLLSSTYLELFVRLAVIYLVMDIISMLTKKIPDLLAETASSGDGLVVNFFIVRYTIVILIIALLIFAKNAPKFFKQMLGIKDNGGKFFSAFGDAMGLGIAVAGAIGSYNNSRMANYEADEANAKIAKRRSLIAGGMSAEAADEWMSKNGDAWAAANAHGGANRAKNVIAGILGASAGIATGSAAASESKGNAIAKTMAAINAQNKRNQNVRAAGRNGSTLLSGLRSLGTEITTGQNAYDNLDARLKQQEQIIKNQQLEIKKEDDINSHYSNMSSRVSSKALTSEKVECILKGDKFSSKLKDLNYGSIGADDVFIGGSYIHWQSVSSAAASSGKDTFEYKWNDASGVEHKRTIKTEDIVQIDNVMKDLATDSYFSKCLDTTLPEEKRIHDGEMDENFESLVDAGVDINEIVTRDSSGNIIFNGGGGFKDVAGRKSRATARRKDELNKQSEAINRQRQGDEGQKAFYDSKFGRNGQ